MVLNPGRSPTGCVPERSIGVLRIRAACIREEGETIVADPEPSERYWSNFVVSLNGVSLVTRDPRATVSFNERRPRDRRPRSLPGDAPQLTRRRHHVLRVRRRRLHLAAALWRRRRRRRAGVHLLLRGCPLVHRLRRERRRGRGALRRGAGRLPGRRHDRARHRRRHLRGDARRQRARGRAARGHRPHASAGERRPRPGARLGRVRDRERGARAGDRGPARLRLRAAGPRQPAPRGLPVRRPDGAELRDAAVLGRRADDLRRRPLQLRGRGRHVQPRDPHLRRGLPESLRGPLRDQPGAGRRRPRRVVRERAADQRELGLRRLPRRQAGDARRRHRDARGRRAGELPHGLLERRLLQLQRPARLLVSVVRQPRLLAVRADRLLGRGAAGRPPRALPGRRRPGGADPRGADRLDARVHQQRLGGRLRASACAARTATARATTR